MLNIQIVMFFLIKSCYNYSKRPDFVPFYYVSVLVQANAFKSDLSVSIISQRLCVNTKRH